MWLEIALAVAAGVWIAVLLFVAALVAAAKSSDDAMDMVLADADADEAAQAASRDRALRTLNVGDAASLLGIAPDTLLAWEARYGFPTSSPSELRYSRSEVLALRDGLRDEVSIASAVARARTQTRRRRAVATAHPGDRRGGGLAS